MRTKKDEPARRLQILNLLAESKEPLNKYKICVRLKEWSEPTLLHDIDALEKEHAIRVVRTDSKATGWKPSKHYDLSPLGVVRLVQNPPCDERRREHMFRLVWSKYRKDLPLIRKLAIQAYLVRLDRAIQEARTALGGVVGPADMDAEFGDASNAREILEMLKSFGGLIQRLLPATPS